MPKKSKEDKQQKKILKNYINEIKENACCMICGEKRPWTLDFHHTQPKKMSIPEMARTNCTLDELKEEINKCIIVCANCHRDIHHDIQLKNGKNI